MIMLPVNIGSITDLDSQKKNTEMPNKTSSLK